MDESFTVQEDTRADVFLSQCIGHLTRSAAQRLLIDGHVTMHGKVLAKNARLKAGDTIECRVPPPVAHKAEAEAIGLDVVYEDEDIIVINKPRGLVVHPGAGNYTGTLVNALLHHCGSSLSGIGGVMRPGIVHRLDKDTSGLMVVAKNDAAHQSLAMQLASQEMGRTYYALCVGRIKLDSQRVDVPIGRHPVNRIKMAPITNGRGKARDAVTHITVLERLPRFTLVEARLETGRTHQIRVHLAYVGHPVLGDPLYGPKKPAFGLDAQVLHAKRLVLRHPTTSEEMTFEVPLPGYFADAVERAKKIT